MHNGTGTGSTCRLKYLDLLIHVKVQLNYIILQCYDTVGWVIWPVKSSLKWPIMCRVGR